MANFIEELLVGLGFEFEGEEGEEFQKQTQLVASSINKIAVAAGVANAALFAMARASAADTDELGKTAATLDTSVEALARWRLAAELAGVDGQQVVGMLERLRTASQQATRTGTGPFQAFAELGVDFEGISSGAVDVAEALETILANARELDRSVAQGALRELGIDTRLLEVSPEQLQAAFEFADKFSKSTTELSKNAAEFNDEWTRTRLLLAGTANLMAERLLPVFSEFFRSIQETLIWLQNVGIPILDELVAAMGGWETVILGLTAVAGLPLLIKAFTTLLGIVKGIGVGMALIAGGAATAATAIAGVAAAGAVGAGIGTLISGQLPENVQDAIGEGIVRTLAFLGVDEAQEAINSMERFEAMQAGARILPPTGSAGVTGADVTNIGGATTSSTNRSSAMNVTNNFHGLKMQEVEAILARMQREELELLDSESNDAIVR